MSESLNIINQNLTTTISDYYSEKHVFITGGTGFFGKVTIEKLLRSCPNIGYIYMLIRPKKGKKLQDRIDYMLQDQLFDTIKETDSQQLSKLIPIAGDCSQLKLGLSETDYSLITSSVSVIYHGAASVRFDDHLQDAIILNTRGTREMSYLALNSVKLSVFVHVSTAYCNSVVGSKIEEQIYPSPLDWKKAINIAEDFNRDMLAILSNKILGDFPNTYTFTKLLGEHVVKDLCEGKIPTVICRPSIVLSTIKEPVPGWIDNLNGPIGILVACGKGLTRISYIAENTHPDYIPVDVVIKAIIVASWDLGLRQQKNSIEVIHCTCGSYKWMSIGNLLKVMKRFAADVPNNTIAWVPKGYVSSNKFYAYFCAIFFHLLPSLFMDLLLKAAGKKAFLFKLQVKIFNTYLQLRYFTLQEWDICNKKFLELETKILKSDRLNWNYDFRNEDMNLYLKKCMLGTRKYLFKESDDTLPAARKNYWRMYWIDKVTMFILYGSLAWLTIHYGLIEKSFEMIYNFIYHHFDGKYELN